MRYADLRDFITQLEARGELKRIRAEVDPRLEMTEIGDRVLRAGGPALLFEKPRGGTLPVLANLFGTVKRVALGMGEEDPAKLREIGTQSGTKKNPKVRLGAGAPGRVQSDSCLHDDRPLRCTGLTAEDRNAELAPTASSLRDLCRRPDRRQ